MIKNLSVEILKNTPVAEQATEIVERKGLGHPDSICDAVADSVSVALCAEYLKNFGVVLHHNIDKGMIVAGRVELGFGKGRVLKPMEVIIGDRATYSAGDVTLPVKAIVNRSVRSWFAANLVHVDPGTDFKVRVVLEPGSVELADIFSRKGRFRGANDTSAAVGYAPLTPTEDAVLKTERLINSPAFKAEFPETGTDVKVMGVRRGAELDLTVACPLLCSMVESEKDYFHKKTMILKAIRGLTSEFAFKDISVALNTLDCKGRGAAGVYLSVLGTSAESADSGQVGRGNRVNGVISLNRPMGTEAAAGKNPVSHVGKIYSVLSHRIAAELYGRIGGIKEVYVWLLSRIGAPIDSPRQVYVMIIPGKRLDKKRVEKSVMEVLEEFFSGIETFTGELARGEYPVC